VRCKLTFPPVNSLVHFLNLQKTTDAAELAGYNNLTNNGTKTRRTDMVDDDDSTYDNNELRKKCLCLVDVSAFHV
jgi:hypothetical protein